MRHREFMATVCVGKELDRFLYSLQVEPSRYSQVIICSPFIDKGLYERISRFAEIARRMGCGVRLITGIGGVPAGLKTWPGKNQIGARTLVTLRRLHAKVYLAIGRERRSSWAVVTSANLTDAGLNKNIELGLLIRATSSDGAHVIDEIRRFLEKLAMATKER